MCIFYNPTHHALFQERFSGWLKAQNMEKTEREKREKLVGYYISQKIQDLMKKEKKLKTIVDLDSFVTNAVFDIN